MLALVLTTLSATLNGTTVVIRRTADYIAVGTDSLWIHDSVITEKNGKKHSTHSTTYGCKIHQFNDTFFAQAGYAGEEVLPVAAQAAREGATIEGRAIAYNRLMKPRIEMGLEALRQGAPVAYQRLFGKGDPF